MELYHEIFTSYFLRNVDMERFFDGTAIVKDQCYQMLCAIKATLEDDTLDDPTCFERIEQIVCIFEQYAQGVEYRHDFG